jgi:hypothetical protein
MSERKWGAGHMAAMGRLGLTELRNAANPSRESVADKEVGLYGSLTQGEIAQAREGPGDGPDQESRGGTLSLSELRSEAQQKNRDTERGKEQDQERDQDRGIER